MRDDLPTTSILEGLLVWVSDPNRVWPTLRIARSVPLSRLEWLWKSRGGSVRDSSTSARALFHVSTDSTSVIKKAYADPHDWFRNPYVYMLITKVSDLDTSKDSWSRIRAFLENCKEESHQYLIVLAANDEEVAQNKRNVDKLKYEVSATTRGRERVVIVPPAIILEEQRPITHLHHSTTHQPLLVRLRECVREGAEARVQAYEDEVSRSFLNRTSAAWCFNSFFALKEGMAFLFVQLGRRDLAVRLYDELQATMNGLLDRHEQRFRKFCEEDAADAAAGVTNPEAKDFRRCLINNSISELDARTYLFSRQISLLLIEKRFAEVAERGLKFITALARRCAEEALDTKKEISAVFRDIWVFCASTALASVLAPAIPSPHEADKELSVHLGTPRERHTARLVAGFHVHALKAFVGLAHVTLPGCLAPTDSIDTNDRSLIAKEVGKTTNEKLRDALQDPKSAQSLHGKLTNAAASLYEMGGRARGASALDGDAGVIRLRNGSYEEAESLLSAQCLRFSNDNGWDDLHKRQRLHLASAEKELDRIQEYLVSCLTMLSMSRATRRLWRGLLSTKDEDETLAEEAAHWVSETAATASRLTRVMKYKADRLFDISVIPSKSPWLEGDAATAIVQIKSDIPADIKVDAIVLECRNSTTKLLATRKHAMYVASHASSPMPSADGTLTPTSDSGSPTSPTRWTPNLTAASRSASVVALRSEGSVVIRKGINNVHVNINEVPHHGLYKVTLVYLFIGNLKLVQGAKKTSAAPTVTIKGSGGLKGSAQSGSSAALSDNAKGEVKFPMFSVSQRQASAFMSVNDTSGLYLVPNAVQFVRVNIVSGERGIKAGAILTCAIVPCQKSYPFTPRITKSLNTKNHDDASPPGLPVLQLRRIPSGFEDVNDIGEAVIDEQVSRGSSFAARIPVTLSDECVQLVDSSSDEDKAERSCIMRLHLYGKEEDCANERAFTRVAEQKLSFSSPLEVSGRIQLRSDWGGGGLIEGNGFEDLPFGDGGTLICSIRRRTKHEHPVILKNVSLELPQWLDLRPEMILPHAELLPCSLGPGTLFSCAFDLVVQDEAQSQNQLPLRGEDNLESFPARETPERSLPRAAAKSMDVMESQDDILQWSMDGRRESMNDMELDRSEAMAIEAFAAEEAPFGHDEQTRGGERVDKISDVEQFEDETTEEDETIQVREAEDVVDLSAPIEEPSKRASAPFTSLSTPKTSMAILSMELKVEGLGVPTETTLSQRVCLSSLRRAYPRYRIERLTLKTAEVGKLMELRFIVQPTSTADVGGHSSPAEYNEGLEQMQLQYEVDADPITWVVVGRRRGMLILDSGVPYAGCATLVPVVPGRHKVPCIRLFAQGGRGLAPSRYENVNAYMQVIVLPSRTVISACSHALTTEARNARNLGRDGRNSQRQKMPEVIASDSFFGS